MQSIFLGRMSESIKQTAEEKVAIVLEGIKCGKSVADICR